MAYLNKPYPGNVSIASTSTPSTNGPDVRRSSSIAQPMVSSASPLPRANKGNSQTSFSLDQIFQQTRRFYQAIERSHEEQRVVWSKEREGWQNERRTLLERIDQLESNVTGFLKSGYLPSGENKNQQSINHSIPSPPSQIPTSRAVWQGPELQPTRTFFDPVVTIQNSTHSDRLNGIAEYPDHEGHERVAVFNSAQTSALKRNTLSTGVSGELIHPNYSGIILKSAAVPTEFRKSTEEAITDLSLANQSISPLSSAELSISIPQPTIRPKLLDVSTANMQSEDLYSRDAGHTPLARLTGSEGTTGTLTPVTTDTECLPLGPLHIETAIRQPNERQDSYFIHSQTDGTNSTDQDPVLQEPLGVSAERTDSDVNFLDKVNEALEKDLTEQSESSELSSPIEKPTAKGHSRGLSEGDDFPRLRMKASCNFGAPFGENSHQ